MQSSSKLILWHPISAKEKKYAHYIGQASWAGARIIQGQWTPQAQKLYDLLILTFSDNGKLADIESLKIASGVSEQEWEDILQYTCQASNNTFVIARKGDWIKYFPTGLEQSDKLQVFWVYQNRSTCPTG